MAPFNITIFLNVWGTFFLLQHKIFSHLLPKIKIFIDVIDDDNYDEEGGNQSEKNITPGPKSALKPWKRFEPTANFMIFKIRSITAS